MDHTIWPGESEKTSFLLAKEGMWEVSKNDLRVMQYLHAPAQTYRLLGMTGKLDSSSWVPGDKVYRVPAQHVLCTKERRVWTPRANAQVLAVAESVNKGRPAVYFQIRGKPSISQVEDEISTFLNKIKSPVA